MIPPSTGLAVNQRCCAFRALKEYADWCLLTARPPKPVVYTSDTQMSRECLLSCLLSLFVLVFALGQNGDKQFGCGGHWVTMVTGYVLL